MTAREVIARALLDLSPGVAPFEDQFLSVQRKRREEADAILAALREAGYVVQSVEPAPRGKVKRSPPKVTLRRVGDGKRRRVSIHAAHRYARMFMGRWCSVWRFA